MIETLLTPTEMHAADARAIAAGTPGIVLMERAGVAVAEAAAALVRPGGRVLVLCGPGNNGGDGFVAARHLSERGFEVRLALLGERGRLKGDAAEAAASWPGTVAAAEAVEPAGFDLVIDALFGAGLDRDLEGPPRALVEGFSVVRVRPRWVRRYDAGVDPPRITEGDCSW